MVWFMLSVDTLVDTILNFVWCWIQVKLQLEWSRTTLTLVACTLDKGHFLAIDDSSTTESDAWWGRVLFFIRWVSININITIVMQSRQQVSTQEDMYVERCPMFVLWCTILPVLTVWQMSHFIIITKTNWDIFLVVPPKLQSAKPLLWNPLK